MSTRMTYNYRPNSNQFHMKKRYEQDYRPQPTKDNTHIQDSKMLLKYHCRFCGKNASRVLHPSKFLLPCKRCHFSSHLINVKADFRLLLGTYQCQERRCGLSWVQRLPFKNIILNTPVCSHCNRLTKISMVVYRNKKVTFKNSLLYKCGNCYKYRTVSLYRVMEKAREDLKAQDSDTTRKFSFPQNPHCQDCKIPMNFLKNLKSIFSSVLPDDRTRAKSYSPTYRLDSDYFQKKPYAPRRIPYQDKPQSYDPSPTGDKSTSLENTSNDNLVNTQVN